jgi:hypothetical protein
VNIGPIVINVLAQQIQTKRMSAVTLDGSLNPTPDVCLFVVYYTMS